MVNTVALIARIRVVGARVVTIRDVAIHPTIGDEARIEKVVDRHDKVQALANEALSLETGPPIEEEN